MEDLDENSNLGHLDLYTDLLADDGAREQESLDELKEKYDNAQQKIISLETELCLSRQNESKLKETLDTVQKNMAALLVTARSEIQRKTQEINELRRNVERKRWNRRYTFLNATADDISEDICDYQQRRKYCYRQYSDDEIKDGHVRQNGHNHGDNNVNIQSSPMATQQRVNVNSAGISLKRRLNSDEESEKQSKRNRTERKDYKMKLPDDTDKDREDKRKHSRKKSTDKVIHGKRTPRKSNSKQDLAKEILEKSKQKLRRTSREVSSQICNDNKETESRRERSPKDIANRKGMQDFVDDSRTISESNSDLDKKNLISTVLTDKENMFVSELSGYLSVEKEKSKDARTITKDSQRDCLSKSRHRDRKSKHEREHKSRLKKEEKRCMNSPLSDKHFRSRSRSRSQSISPKKKRSRKSCDSPSSPKKYEQESSRSISSQKQSSNSPEKKFSSPKSVVMDLREKLRAGRQCENQTNKEKINRDAYVKHSVDRELLMRRQYAEVKEEKWISPSVSPVKNKQVDGHRLKVDISEESKTEILHMDQVEKTPKDCAVKKEFENSKNICTGNKNVMDETLAGDQIPAVDPLGLMNKSKLKDTTKNQKAVFNVSDICDKKLSPREKAMLFKEFSDIQKDVMDKPGSSEKSSFWVELNDSSVVLNSNLDDLHANEKIDSKEKEENKSDTEEMCKKYTTLPKKVKISPLDIDKAEKVKTYEPDVCDKNNISHKVEEKECDTEDSIDEEKMELIQEELYKDSEMVRNLKNETRQDVRTIDIHGQKHAERYLGRPLQNSSSKKKNKKKQRHKPSESNSESESTPKEITEGSSENLNTGFNHEIGKDVIVKGSESIEGKNDKNQEKSHSDTDKDFSDKYNTCKDKNRLDPDECDKVDNSQSKSDSEEKVHLRGLEAQEVFKNSINHCENVTSSPVEQIKIRSKKEESSDSLFNKEYDGILNSQNNGISDLKIEINQICVPDVITNDDADSVDYESQDMCVRSQGNSDTVTHDEKESSDENDGSCEEGEITQSDESDQVSESEIKLSDNNNSYEFSVHLTETENLEFQYESPCKKTPVKHRHELSSKSDKSRLSEKSKQKEKGTSSSRRNIFSRSRTRSKSREKDKYQKLDERKWKELNVSKEGRSRSPGKKSSRSRSPAKDSLRLSSRKSDRPRNLSRDRHKYDRDREKLETYSTHTREQSDIDKRDKEKDIDRSSGERSERHSRDTRERYQRHSRDSRERDDNSMSRTRKNEIESRKNKPREKDHGRKTREVKGTIKDRLGTVKVDHKDGKLEIGDRNNDVNSRPDKNISDRKFDGSKHLSHRKSDGTLPSQTGSVKISDKKFDRSECLSDKKSDSTLPSQTGLNSGTRPVVSYSDIDLSSISEDQSDEHVKNKANLDGVDVFEMEIKISNERPKDSYSDLDITICSEVETQQCRDYSENVKEEKYKKLEADMEKLNVTLEELSEKQNDNKNELEMAQEKNKKIENCKGSRKEDNVCNSMKGVSNEINISRNRLEDDLVLSSDNDSDSESEGMGKGDDEKIVNNQNDMCEKINWSNDQNDVCVKTDQQKAVNNQIDMCENTNQTKTILDNVEVQNLFSNDATNMTNMISNSDLDNVHCQNLPCNELDTTTQMLNENVFEQKSGLVKERKVTSKDAKTPTKGNVFSMYTDVDDAVLDLFSSSPVSSIECSSPMKQRLKQFAGENIHKSQISAGEIEQSDLITKMGEIHDSDIGDDSDGVELELTLCNDTMALILSAKKTGTNNYVKETAKTSSGKDVGSEMDIHLSNSEPEFEKSPVLKVKSGELGIKKSPILNVKSIELEKEKSPILKVKNRNLSDQSNLGIIEKVETNLVEINSSSSSNVVSIKLNQECEESIQVDTALTNVTAKTVSSNSDFSSEVQMEIKNDEEIKVEECCDNSGVKKETSVTVDPKESPAIDLEDGEITESDDDNTDAMVTDSLDDIDLKELIDLRKKLLAESKFEKCEETGKNTKKRDKSDREKHSYNMSDRERHSFNRSEHQNSGETRKRHQSGSSRSDSPRSMEHRRLEFKEGFGKRDLHTSSPKGSGSSSRHSKDKYHRSESGDRKAQVSKEKPHKSDSHRNSKSSTSDRTPCGEKSKHSIVVGRKTAVLAKDFKSDTKEKSKDVKMCDVISKSERDRKGSPRWERCSEREKEAKRSEYEYRKFCKSEMNTYKVPNVSSVSEHRTGESKSRHLERDRKIEEKGHYRKSDNDSRKIKKDAKSECRNESSDSRKSNEEIRCKNDQKLATGKSSETSKIKSKKHTEDINEKNKLEDKITKHSEIKTCHKSTSPQRCKNKSITPERCKDKSTTPERCKDKSTTPERCKDNSTTPERCKDNSTTPETCKDNSTTPERCKDNSTTPERCKDNSTTPERCKDNSTTPERCKDNSTTPERCKDNSTTPETCKNKSTTQNSCKDKSTTPEQCSEK